ncbi:heterokaryon incompatibility protein-domain-containing protein [Boeremia exigua]|uniref:heterokaryon incompatibility protein-domain-containing protein n=1 Tax=Boeremia exigua TaxID=749465 RepID=UPI001E8D2604|nr:heterokaryon incompatibility protein-domain-containing protein [Boeremia exigua]KAH6616856.1 heterokaryon incompatibility protein-domain-containing protein [Boeremia exigua]
MPYCDLCNGLTIEGLFPPNIYHHAKTLAALEESGKTCELCKLLYRCIRPAGDYRTEYHPRFLSSSKAPRLVGWTDDMLLSYDLEACSDTGASDGASQLPTNACSVASNVVSIKLQILEESEIQKKESFLPSLDGFTHIGIWTESPHMLTSLTLFVHEGDELGYRASLEEGQHRFISGRVLTSHHPSKAYFDVARRWFNHCVSRHTECGDHLSLQNSTVPDRVIDVALYGGQPRLINSMGLRSRYATLSHCWGGLPMSELPKTFREAIVICRALMIPYLWIDSICIIQDSPTDWEIQSSKMHSIYHDSAVTLAALDAANSSKGLFIPKLPFVDVFPLHQQFGNGKGQAYVGPPTWTKFSHSSGPYNDHIGWVYEALQDMFSQTSYIRRGVLESRAWAMQELRLSQRVLYFFKGEMMWRCPEAIMRQNGSWKAPNRMFQLRFALERHSMGFESVRNLLAERGHPLVHHRNDNDENSGSETHESRVVQAGTSPRTLGAIDNSVERNSNTLVFDLVLEGSNGYDILETWYHLVRDYSQCQLTFHADKLPALSGIASRIHAITHDQYLAGHWRINLEKTLFWKGQGRVKVYRAPSWSWASSEGHLGDLYGIDAQEDQTLPPLEVLDACTKIDGGNPFGRVTSGRIIINARTIEAIWNPEQQCWDSRSRSCSGKIHTDSTHPLGITDCDGNPIGYWSYDDRLYGVLPGLPLDMHATQAAIEARMCPVMPDLRVPCGTPKEPVQPRYDDAAGEIDLFWSKAAYLPENLLLVQGPGIACQNEENDVVDCSDQEIVVVLVLQKSNTDPDTFQRIALNPTTAQQPPARSPTHHQKHQSSVPTTTQAHHNTPCARTTRIEPKDTTSADDLRVLWCTCGVDSRDRHDTEPDTESETEEHETARAQTDISAQCCWVVPLETVTGDSRRRDAPVPLLFAVRQRGMRLLCRGVGRDNACRVALWRCSGRETGGWDGGVGARWCFVRGETECQLGGEGRRSGW